MSRYTPIKEIVVGDKIHVPKFKKYTEVLKIDKETRNFKDYILLTFEEGQVKYKNFITVKKFKVKVEDIRISKGYVKEMKKKEPMNIVDLSSRLNSYFLNIKWFKRKDKFGRKNTICDCGEIVRYSKYCSCGKLGI